MKKEFLDELRTNLENLEVNDIDEVIEYFDEMIEDKKENGLDEKVIIENLDSPKEIAFVLKGQEEKANPQKEDIDSNEYVSDINYVTKIEIEDTNLDIQVRYSEDNKIHFLFPKDINFEFEINHDTLSIERDDSFTNSRKMAKVELYLPYDYHDELKIDVVNGNISISNIELEELKIDTVNGKINLDGTSIQELKIDSVNNAVELNNIEGYELKIDTVNGRVRSNGIQYDFIKIDSVNAYGYISINGKEEEYAVKIEKMFKEYKMRMHLKDSKYLKIESAMGNIEYEFLD